MTRYEAHTLHDAHDCWRCAMVDRERLLATLDAARSRPLAGLDVERLAQAMEVTVDDIDLLPSLHAEKVAAEYARLSDT